VDHTPGRYGHDLTAIGAVMFPPVSQGRVTTGVLFVDDRVFESYGAPVTHAWRPDRVVRSAELPGLCIETTTVCVPGEPAVTIDVTVHNTGDARRTVPLTFALNARVTATGEAWLEPESPSARNTATAGPGRITFDGGTARSVRGVDVPEAAVRLSGVVPAPVEGFEVGLGGAGRGGEITVSVDVPAGSSRRFGFVQAVATSAAAAAAAFERVVADVPAAMRAAEEFWNHQLAAVFTPGNSEFSGHLPVLETSSDALRRLYWWGALSVLWFRRDFPGNVLGRSYDTLMPNYWAATTFIWDFSLSSLTHALLDPEPMRRQLDHWIASDIHTHFGTSSLTGGPVGRWYSVNDYAMTRLVTDYVRFTGDTGYLEKVGEHLRTWATAWQARRSGSALADYGEIDNLLECVSSYTHEVASLNAANVWAMRVAADATDLSGDADGAQTLRAEAAALVPEVLDLYEPGSGFSPPANPTAPGCRCGTATTSRWSARRSRTTSPRTSGRRWSSSSSVSCIPRAGCALSPWDLDASYSMRPDHQWNGAYPAWPADTARSLVALGAPQVAADWIEGLARSANQGPPGQGHFVEEAQPPLNGGARKAPPQLPYILDWACSSAGAWVALVIESFFGVDPRLDGALAVDGCMQLIDPEAKLCNLRIGGRLVDVHADGTVVEAS
jgi:hypothetical protein